MSLMVVRPWRIKIDCTQFRVEREGTLLLLRLKRRFVISIRGETSVEGKLGRLVEKLTILFEAVSLCRCCYFASFPYNIIH